MQEKSLEALRRAIGNKYRSWALSEENPMNAANRMSTGEYVAVNIVPKFKLSREDRAFTIGSCFARNVEHKLKAIGVNVLTYDFALPAKYYKGTDENTKDHRGVLNKYNTHSIRTEVLRSLGEISDIPDEGFINIGGDLWLDPQASNTTANSLDEIRSVRAILDEVNGRIKNATIVFITLGLTETWHDNVTGMSLNRPPSPRIIKKFSDRFFFRNATIKETEENLHDIVAAIRKHNQSAKIVVTVSPVPLGNTFTSDDIIVANAYSKAVLLTSARTVANSYDFVDYFPSYEIVTSSPRDKTWKEDGLHVKNDAVGFVMQVFKAAYFD